MYPPSMAAPAVSRNETVDTSRHYTELYLGYASNLSPTTMKGRCPDSLFCGLARLDGWRWHINETGYASIHASADDVVYGALYFLSPRDEAGLDESEGVPWMYQKQWFDVVRIGPDGAELGQTVRCMTYVDGERVTDGPVMPDYVVWINQAIRHTTSLGLPAAYVEKYFRPFMPPPNKHDEREMEMVRVMSPRTWEQHMAERP